MPSFRKKGLGTRMLKALINWLKSKRVARVKADAYCGNPALKLWKKLGLKPYSVGLF
ncbi:MAG: GNAT family N-acetyltransferase [archaeon]